MEGDSISSLESETAGEDNIGPVASIVFVLLRDYARLILRRVLGGEFLSEVNLLSASSSSKNDRHYY